jgi:hypothetical protein
MGQDRDDDITEADIANAIIETEREIAGAAWGDEETEALDASGDRSLEELGEGLEGQHEPDDGETDDDESEEDPESEGEAEGDKPAVVEPPAGEKKPVEPEDEPRGRVPAGRLREANERARQAEERARTIETEREAERTRVAALEAQMQTLTSLLQGQRNQPPPTPAPKVEPPAVPDIFENPQGFVEHITNQIRSEMGTVRQDLKQTQVETSFRIAHVKHKEEFPEAMGAINKLDANNPDDRVVVQRIYNSPDPGEALVSWHKRNKTLALVGDDPNAYAERIRDETRKALMQDPEFRKSLIADLRGDAERGDNGNPRTTTRLPRSLARASGSNAGANRGEQIDGSDQAVADAAWR